MSCSDGQICLYLANESYADLGRYQQQELQGKTALEQLIQPRLKCLALWPKPVAAEYKMQFERRLTCLGMGTAGPANSSGFGVGCGLV